MDKITVKKVNSKSTKLPSPETNKTGTNYVRMEDSKIFIEIPNMPILQINSVKLQNHLLSSAHNDLTVKTR